MADKSELQGQAELIEARRESRSLYWMVGIFSLFVNLLMLTGPLYMLNVYDRVLGSRSLETLIALSVLVAFMYGMMGILDYVRGRVMGRVGARFQARMDRRVFGAVLKATTLNRAPEEARTGLRDLESIQRLITSPALMALYDIPWTNPNRSAAKSAMKAKWSIHWACVGQPSIAGKLHAARLWMRRLARQMRLAPLPRLPNLSGCFYSRRCWA